MGASSTRIRDGRGVPLPSLPRGNVGVVTLALAGWRSDGVVGRDVGVTGRDATRSLRLAGAAGRRFVGVVARLVTRLEDAVLWWWWWWWW